MKTFLSRDIVTLGKEGTTEPGGEGVGDEKEDFD